MEDLLLFPFTQEEVNLVVPRHGVRYHQEDLPCAKYLLKENEKNHLVASWRPWRLFYNKQREEGYAKLEKWVTIGAFIQQSNGRIDFLHYGFSGKSITTISPVDGVNLILRPLRDDVMRDQVRDLVLNWVWEKTGRPILHPIDMLPLHYMALDLLPHWYMLDRLESNRLYLDELHLPKPYLAKDITQACQFMFNSRAKKFTKPIKKAVTHALTMGIEAQDFVNDPVGIGNWMQVCWTLFKNDPNKFSKYYMQIIALPHWLTQRFSATLIPQFSPHEMENIIQMDHHSIMSLCDALRTADNLLAVYNIDLRDEVKRLYRRPAEAERLVQRRHQEMLQMHRDQRHAIERAEQADFMAMAIPQKHEPLVTESGYTITQAVTVGEVYDWGNYMHNCISGYARSALSEECILFAVVEGEEIIANGEVGRDGGLRQLLARFNERLEDTVKEDIVMALIDNAWVKSIDHAWM